jgi:hypothetical protein
MSPAYGCDFPVERDAITLTDWAEAVMLVEEMAEFSEADLRGRIIEQAEVEPDEDEIPGRQQVEDILREVDRRARFAPASYPFRRGEYGIERSDQRLIGIYAFLLYLSMPDTPFRRQVYSNAVTPLFDFVGAAALSDLLGGEAQVIRFGWPVTGDRPTGPRKALLWLTAELGLSHDKGAPLSEGLKDGGVDVVLWRPFEDGRGGFPILLAQCTVGRREWQKKGRDIQRPIWRRYLGLGWDPPTALVLPFCVHQPDRFHAWDLANHDVSYIIDRVRLLELLSSVKPTDITEHERIREWTSERARDLALT